MSLPRDLDKARDMNKWEKRKDGKKQTTRKEEKGWRIRPKKEADTRDVDLEDLTMKINQQFRCQKCQSISSIYAPLCPVCDESNPTYVPHT